MKDFEARLKEYQDAVNKRLDELSLVPDVPEKSVYEAMRYSLLAGGKRIRPVICMAVSEMLCGEDSYGGAALEVGCAIECVHTYSLIHDDLPCMDNDDLRRGKPTCHRVFPENIALLAGDALLNKAFEILSGDCGGISTDIALSCVRCLSEASSASGMIGGQVIDLEGENRDDLTMDELILMHRKKTGAMLDASAVCGCIAAGVSDKNSETVKKIREFSSSLGLAFQIKDDILDVVGDESVLGKPIGSDAESGKNTFVTMTSLEDAEARLSELTNAALDALDFFGDRAWFLRELTLKLASREK